MTFRLGVDIGGTFTDFTLVNDATRAVTTEKRLTTPDDPSRAVIEGVAAILESSGRAISEVTTVVHGTTLVTNAIIERRGATTGMLVNSGMKDVLDIARETRYDLFDLRIAFPAPLVSRQMRREIGGRILFDGSEAEPLDEEEVRAALRSLAKAGDVQSLAVCLMHSYANPAHERRAAEIARAELPNCYVSCSAEVFPFIREYERWTTTTMNAYVQPLVDRYISRLEQGLAGLGFGGQFYIMTSSGGTFGAATARRFPVRLIESGPAAGALMSGVHGRRLRLGNVLSFDMGGTTAKGALVRGGQPLRKYDIEVARVHEFKPGSGLTAKVPTIDLIEIGAGGGSIAEIDDRGLIRVGPRSAGAAPGPACYGQGGKRPTLTDANLILGYLDPAYFLGGRMALDRRAAERALLETIGAPLGLDLPRAAWGVHEIINEDVARAFRVHASERAFDYREATMIAFGGSGPMHAARIARKLRVPRVIFPMGAGVMSALGLLASPLSFETVRSRRVSLGNVSDAVLDAAFGELEREVIAPLLDAGVARSAIELRRALDMRYEGQGYEVDVLLDAGHRAADMKDAFESAYRALYGASLHHDRIEIVNWKLEASAPRPDAHAALDFVDLAPGRAPRKGSRPAYFEAAGGYIECSVYDRYALRPGMKFEGPALVEERESTSVVGPADEFLVDDEYNIVVQLADFEAAR